MIDSVIRSFLIPVVALAAVMGCDAQLSESRSPPPSALAAVIRPTGIAVDATTIYVTMDGLAPLQTVPVGGGTASMLAVQGLGLGIVSDGDRLYWSGQHELLRCEKSDCAGTRVTMARPLGYISSLRVDATSVYWAEVQNDGPGRVMKIGKDAVAPSADGGFDAASDGGASALDGGAPADLPVQIGMANVPYDLAIDGTSVYWIEQQFPGAGVWKAPLTGGPAVQVVASTKAEPGPIALDDQNVYFADGPGTVYKAPKTGGAGAVVLDNLGMFPVGLATDGANLYMLGPTKLVSKPLAGGSIRTVGVQIGSAAAMTLDAASIYVTDRGASVVLKFAKPSDGP